VIDAFFAWAGSNAPAMNDGYYFGLQGYCEIYGLILLAL
jgi:hypothetical protein